MYDESPMGKIKLQRYTAKSYITVWNDVANKWTLLVEVMGAKCANHDHAEMCAELFAKCLEKGATKESIVAIRDLMLAKARSEPLVEQSSCKKRPSGQLLDETPSKKRPAAAK